MIWYSHWDTSAQFRNIEIGLATLRRDGFGCFSLQAPANDGHFVTSALESSGRPLDLRINAEYVDRPLPGFSGSDAARVAVPGTQQAVAWPRGHGPRLAAGTRFAIRVAFPVNSPARVYALTVSA